MFNDGTARTRPRNVLSRASTLAQIAQGLSSDPLVRVGSDRYGRGLFGRAPRRVRKHLWVSMAVDAGDQSCSGFVARLSLLSKVGALAGSLDYEQVLSAVARLSIPELADWCVVDVVEDGEVRRMEVAHRDPSRAALAAALRSFPLDHAARQRLPAARALRSGRPVPLPAYGDDRLREETHGEYLDLTLQLGVCSVLVVPATLSSARATMTFLATSESGRRYGPEDVALAEELVRRAAQ